MDSPLNSPFKAAIDLQQLKIVFILIKNTMDNPIPSSELIGYVIELENFESTTLEDQVIQKAKKAGFLSEHDESYAYKVSWIKKVAKNAEDAFNLEAIIENEPLELTMANFKQLREERELRVNEILELLSKGVLDSVPPYKG